MMIFLPIIIIQFINFNFITNNQIYYYHLINITRFKMELIMD